MILFCWEYGGGLGHLAKLLPLARRLKAQGHAVACVLRDLARVHEAFAPGELELFQAPVWLHKTHGLPEPAVSYPDILLREGWLDPNHLEGLARGWRNLFERLAPRVVVCDHAPTALLAARGLPPRIAAIGNGFYLPQAATPMPSHIPGVQGLEERLAKVDALATANANHALATLEAPRLERFADLFDIDERFLVTTPELDHYRGRSGARYWGSLSEAIGREAPRWPAGAGARVLVYLEGGHPWLPAALEALEALGARTVVYAPGIADRLKAGRSPTQFWFAPAPLDMAAAAADCDAAVLTAGIGAVGALLRAGKPLVLLPTHLEQVITTHNVVRLGAGTAPGEGPPAAARVRTAIDEVLHNPNPRARAREFAERYAADGPQAVAERIVERIKALAA